MNTSLKLAVVGPSWPFRSGVARETTLLAKELHSKGVLSRFLTAKELYPILLFPGQNARDPQFCDNLPFAEPTYTLLDPRTWTSVTREIEKSEVDVVLTPVWTAANLGFFLWLTRVCSKPVVGLIHNLEDHERYSVSTRLARRLAGNLSGFVCHSQQTKTYLGERYGRKPVVFRPIPPTPLYAAVEKQQARRDLKLGEQDFVFFFQGLIRPYKGLDLLLEAFARIAEQKSVKLLISGEPWDPSAGTIWDRIRALGLETCVQTALHWQSPEALHRWFSASDAVVLPYQESSGSGVVATARAYGLPILASEPLRGAIEGGENISYFETNVSALSERLLETLSSQKRATPLSRELISGEWKQYADAVESLCQEVLSLRNEGMVRMPAVTRLKKLKSWIPGRVLL